MRDNLCPDEVLPGNTELQYRISHGMFPTGDKNLEPQIWRALPLIYPNILTSYS